MPPLLRATLLILTLLTLIGLGSFALLTGRLPLTTYVLLLALTGTALFTTLLLHVTRPKPAARDQALLQILRDVHDGRYRPAPDELLRFHRRGWWKAGALTPAGHDALAQLPPEPTP